MIDPQSALRAREALERQSFALAGVQRRVEDAGALIPPSSEAGWTGTAHDFYELGLREVALAVGRACEAILEARGATDLALDSLARRGG